MGTSGSYSGSGGKIGDRIRDSLSDWIDSQPSDAEAPRPQRKLDPSVLLPAVQLFRPRTSRASGGGDGPGGGGGAAPGGVGTGGGRQGGGPTRTVVTSADTAGRAAAAAHAYRTGDVETLDRLGLDYSELTDLDPFETSRRIVEAACGPHAQSTIEDYEQRLVAFDVAEWVLSHDHEGQMPAPEEIVRHTIHLIIAETVLSEAGEVINGSNHAALTEQEIRDAAEALAAREDLSADGVSETEFAEALERGIETLRDIVKGGD